MVREIKKSSFSKNLKTIALSPFIFPFLTFLFVLFTLPVIYFTSQKEQDIRQDAATIATNSVIVNTDETSYVQATGAVLTFNNIIISILTVILTTIGITTIVIYIYRKRVAVY